MIKKILIANRGEIALRIMKTAQKMDIKTVAVYSDADRNALHVRFANEVIYLGAAPSASSYLAIDKIIDAALKTGADAIHPGYGFLSENADFAEKVKEAGIIFIGPEPSAIRVMGDKLQAKAAVKAYDIPMVPGHDKSIMDIQLAKRIAKEIGFPILIKAAAGGGGKGMRVVENEHELPEQMERAVSEATSSFGNGTVFIEKYILAPRHIEIQILADSHGNVIHLFERECSVQRRHQKIVEEAPSVVVTPKVRKAMGEAAIKVVKACNYVGAGTVEFLLDKDHNFYFLEMNTRLQVEHPVTELITGIDLVEQQIKVARGESLSIEQKDLIINGHALELRIYAEDPLNNFLPSIGTLEKYQRPGGEGIRLDDGYEEGMTIPIYYDPMLAKLITYGKDRMAAIKLMIQAIEQYKIEGIATTLSFGRFVCEHEAFVSGQFDTQFVKKHYCSNKLKEERVVENKLAAMVSLKLYLENKNRLKVADVGESNWGKKWK